jgi:citrate lyase subunit beta/citryl-CoA lyase
MRSLLFTPGGAVKMLAKAASSEADVVIFDLEDAVHPDTKTEARGLTTQALRDASRDGPQIYVRINPLDSAWCEADLESVVPLRPDGIMLPKLTGPQDMDRLDALIARHEPAGAKGAIRIIAVCTETPAATLSLAAASWQRPRLAGLLWGGEDLSAEIGASANRDAVGAYTAPFQLARSLCLLAARAAGVVPIDAVFTNFRDGAGLAREAEAARRDGFSAKAAIHPSQITVINAAFTPTEAERQWAGRVVAALQASRSGVTQIDGVMIDAPHLAQARRILTAAAKGRSGG